MEVKPIVGRGLADREVSPQVGKQQAAHAEFAKRFAEGGDLASLTKEEAAERQKAFGTEQGCEP